MTGTNELSLVQATAVEEAEKI